MSRRRPEGSPDLRTVHPGLRPMYRAWRAFARTRERGTREEYRLAYLAAVAENRKLDAIRAAAVLEAEVARVTAMLRELMGPDEADGAAE